jgi:hypothetical protein
LAAKRRARPRKRKRKKRPRKRPRRSARRPRRPPARASRLPRRARMGRRRRRLSRRLRMVLSRFRCRLRRVGGVVARRGVGVCLVALVEEIRTCFCRVPIRHRAVMRCSSFSSLPLSLPRVPVLAAHPQTSQLSSAIGLTWCVRGRGFLARVCVSVRCDAHVCSVCHVNALCCGRVRGSCCVGICSFRW